MLLLQGAREVAKPSLLTEITPNNRNGNNNNDNVAVEDQKPDGEKKGMKRKLDAQDCCTSLEKREKTASDDQKQNNYQAEMNHLKKIKNVPKISLTCLNYTSTAHRICYICLKKGRTLKMQM